MAHTSGRGAQAWHREGGQRREDFVGAHGGRIRTLYLEAETGEPWLRSEDMKPCLKKCYHTTDSTGIYMQSTGTEKGEPGGAGVKLGQRRAGQE